jgi:hypothetical protein
MEKNENEKKKSFSGRLVVAIVIILLVGAVVYFWLNSKNQVSTTPVATNAPLQVVVVGGKITVDNTDANPIPVKGKVTIDNTADNPVNVSCCGNGNCEDKKPCSAKKEAYVPAQKQAYIPAPTPTCISACTFGAKQCVGSQVQTCGLEGACYKWQATQNCASNEYCSSGSCIRQQQRTENRCYNGDVYEYVNGAMGRLVQDCGNSTYEETYRCDGSDTLQRKYVERGCENSSCYSRTTWRYQDSCSYGCNGNRCSSQQSSQSTVAATPTTVNVTVNVSQSQTQSQQPVATTQQPIAQESHTGTSFSAPVDQNLASNCATTGTCGAFTVPVGTCTGANCGTFTPPTGCTGGNCGTFVPPVGGSIVAPPI